MAAVSMQSLLPKNWRKLRGASYRGARFYVYRGDADEGWVVVDDAYATVLTGFSNLKEVRGFRKFVNEYVKRWGDIDFRSMPYNLNDPLHYDDPEAVREWREEQKAKDVPSYVEVVKREMN